MKTLFINIIFLFCNTTIVFSQYTFFKIYRTEHQEYAYEVIQANDGSYIIAGKRGSDQYYTDANALAMHIDFEGNLINEIVFKDVNRTSFFIVDKMPANENEFMLIGSKDSITDISMNSSLTVCVVDINLTIHTNSCFHTLTNHKIGPFKHAIANDSTIYLLLQDWDLINSPNVSHIMVSEIKLPCDSIRTYWPTPGNPNHFQIPQDIQFLQQIDELRVVYNGGMFDFDKDIFVKIIHLDKNLNQDTIKYAPPRSRVSACTTSFTDTSYLLTTTATHPELYNNSNVIQIHELDKNSDTIKGTYFYNHPDTVLYAGFGTNTTINNSTIFTIGIYNINTSQFPWQNSPTWLQITLMDFDFNIYGQYFYGGDALYYPFCIISTDDGGVIVTGIMWDYNIPGNFQHDIFALKLNSEGQIVNIPEDATWQSSQAILYPNPAGDVVNIEFSMVYSEAVFILTDMSGKTVMETPLTANRQSVNISAVSPGTYVYRIFNNMGLDERGKIVVE